jgi:hypothetical protein
VIVGKTLDDLASMILKSGDVPYSAGATLQNGV